jgi:hypothetical protein
MSETRCLHDTQRHQQYIFGIACISIVLKAEWWNQFFIEAVSLAATAYATCVVFINITFFSIKFQSRRVKVGLGIAQYSALFWFTKQTSRRPGVNREAE